MDKVQKAKAAIPDGIILDNRFNSVKASEFAEKLKNDSELKKYYYLSKQVLMKCFDLWRKSDPNYELTKPLMYGNISTPKIVKRTYFEVVLLSQYFDEKAWGKLYLMINELEDLIKEMNVKI